MSSKSEQLRDHARRCRELAETAMTDEGRAILAEMAERYEGELNLAERAAARPELASAGA